MKTEKTNITELISAMFSYEFLDGGVDYDTIEQIHRGEIDDWLSALDRSGVLAADVVTDIARRWHEHPRCLLDVLLTDADDVTKRRCTTAWAALDRIAPLGHVG